MPIYDNHKAIHIHIPKVAGAFLYHRLFKYSNNLPNFTTLCGWDNDTPLNHATYLELKKYIPADKLKNYFLFTIVRNPYAKLVSEYNYHKDAYYQTDFKSFVKQILRYDKAVPNRHLLPQYKFLLGDLGEINSRINIYKYEDFEYAVRDICKNVGIGFDQELFKKKINESEYDGKSYVDYYDDETVEIVKRIYKKDFELFGYSEELDKLGN
jgi:hypothetical protein